MGGMELPIEFSELALTVFDVPGIVGTCCFVCCSPQTNRKNVTFADVWMTCSCEQQFPGMALVSCTTSYMLGVQSH